MGEAKREKGKNKMMEMGTRKEDESEESETVETMQICSRVSKFL